eukprot:TRINITY_DN110086_c0_g1_i1.p1 TRINITY_DN110086_c0_g1~~TRINITY_DN110086_c0_g1_i1.p1  ORF type:complete len:199 (+),score=41.81 TRINITY_DN110086_c0_g1_i1:82-678(+)
MTFTSINRLRCLRFLTCSILVGVCAAAPRQEPQKHEVTLQAIGADGSIHSEGTATRSSSLMRSETSVSAGGGSISVEQTPLKAQEVEEHKVAPAALPEKTEAEASESLNSAAEDEFLPGMNAADLMYKAYDMMYGTTGIVDEDYPFACICDETGACQDDSMLTTCKGNAGMGNAAIRGESLAIPSVLILVYGYIAVCH